MKILVGLGNPDKEYENTNHNIGFRVVDRLAKKYGVKFKTEKKLDSDIATIGTGDNRIILCKPLTYMNNSGLAVVKIVNFYKIDTATELFVICDDFDIKEGSIRIRAKAGDSTHNGVRSIKRELASSEFIRVKLSIAPKTEFMSVADFVLAKSVGVAVKHSEDLGVEAMTDLIDGKTLDQIMTKYSC